MVARPQGLEREIFGIMATGLKSRPPTREL